MKMDMQIEQAVVSSVESRAEQKNELVSRSPGIHDPLLRNLCQWSPGRLELASGQTESISFFPTDCGKLALCRSVIGRQESSRSGGRRIVSYLVVVNPVQLRGYRNNVVLLARCLLSMGKLMLQTIEDPVMPLLEIPDRCWLEPINPSHSTVETEKITRAIAIHRQVIMIGQPDPLAFLGDFLDALPVEDRMRYSFATGLNVLEERPFNLQFFSETTPVLEKQLATLQLRTINFKPRPVQLV